MLQPFRPSLISIAAVLWPALVLGSSDADSVDFSRDIEPLLEDNCIQCHRERKHKAGLRLDSKSAAMAGSYFGTEPVILPGDASNSVLFQRIASNDEDERMPPRGAPLEASEIELIRRWIDEGAEWPDEEVETDFELHWAYESLQPTELPQPRNSEWARNEIDIFVLDRLQREGLEPSPEADRSTLLRRLSLDLTGLPPTPDELEAFLGNDSDTAYEEQVDRLFASPHYGERQARGWLDLARYADTNGYEKDSIRTMWRYRDWVIRAFNSDMSFDRFTIEQLAGDLLPEPTLEQRIATGFHRNTMINAEGGVDPEEYRVAAVVDRVNTTAMVWLGTTLACAQCHTHKYDPFSQREYFRLFAYFNSSADIGPSDEPKIDAPTPEEALEEERAVAELAILDERLSTWTPALAGELALFEEEQAQAGKSWSTLRPKTFSGDEGTTLAMLEDGSLLAVGKELARDTYDLLFDLPEVEVQRLRVDVLTHEALPNGGPGRADHNNFVLSEIEVIATERSSGEEHTIRPAGASADFFQEGSPTWPAESSIDGDPSTGWAIAGGTDHPHQLVLDLAEPLDGKRHSHLRLRLAQHYGSMHVIGRLRISFSQEAGSGATLVRPDIEELLTEAGDRTPEDQARLEAWFLSAAPSLAEARERKRALGDRHRPPTSLVMQELETPRTTHVLERGSFLAPGEEVTPGVPAVLTPLHEGARTDRLGLARWLVSPENPLTARVTVNRFWQQVFGRGLVPTPEDFGSQGQAPTHPELLDWLALELQRDGWSIKSTLKRFVLSSTYRQESTASPELRQRDPQNILLARGARYRVEAEMVRDIALVASGLLSETIGGPSVFPPQPPGIWNSTYSADRWNTAGGPDRFRRGLYTFWRRTAPYPTFMAFDATSRELACARRPGSNTPLQALALLNDPAFIELAIGLAGRLLREGGDQDRARVELGFELCTGRLPDAREVAMLLELLASERDHYLNSIDSARTLVSSEVDLGTNELDPIELAAWTVLANVLLNLDETITRG